MSKPSVHELSAEEIRAGILLALEANGGEVGSTPLAGQVAKATGCDYATPRPYERDKFNDRVRSAATSMVQKGTIARVETLRRGKYSSRFMYRTIDRQRAEEKAAEFRKGIADKANERWAGITRRLRMQGFELTMQKGLSAADWEALLNRLEAGQKTEAGLQWANDWSKRETVEVSE